MNDGSSDNTPEIIESLKDRYPVVPLHREPPNGFGLAVREGLKHAAGDLLVLFMGGGSDHPHDVVRYYQALAEGYDCVFGSRFIPAGKVQNYPRLKLLLNRLGNYLIRVLFRVPHNDITNAFKGYRVEVVRRIEPLESRTFDITLELPIKAILLGCTWTTVPISWNGRSTGTSKQHLVEVTRTYLSTLMKLWRLKQSSTEKAAEKASAG